MGKQILSVGIDIGTTTSQVVFSRLTLANQSSIARVPEINIINKEIIYRSPIHFTPLIDRQTIDGDALANIVKKEFSKASIAPADITVGAAIITGESSRKENAKDVIHALGDLAGDFVVASAGPDLEGIIAGKGSGAAALSSDKKTIVANIDIGGGTSNIALFDDGVALDTTCLDIGGRQVMFKKNSMIVDYIAPKTAKICNKMGLNLRVGEVANPSELDKLCKRYVELLAEALGLINTSGDLETIMTDHLLKDSYNISQVVISGGVADAVYYDNESQSPWLYNDIGIILGRAIKKYFPIPLSGAQETIRATVIGAGAFTTSLSGSTVCISNDKLPLKNLPVIKFSASEELYPRNKLITTIEQKIDWNLNELLNGLVLAFGFNRHYNYDDLKEFAEILIIATTKLQNHGKVLAIVLEDDYAKALGQLLQQKSSFNFIVLDSIKVTDGDFMDIGIPLYEGSVVPVVVKSLIFTK